MGTVMLRGYGSMLTYTSGHRAGAHNPSPPPTHPPTRPIQTSRVACRGGGSMWCPVAFPCLPVRLALAYETRVSLTNLLGGARLTAKCVSKQDAPHNSFEDRKHTATMLEHRPSTCGMRPRVPLVTPACPSRPPSTRLGNQG